jgi:uncharacterized protein (DUF362 family)
MEDSIDRRRFLAASTAAGVSFLLGDPINQIVRSATLRSPAADLAVVRSDNAYDAARKAVEILGGMHRFVSHGSRVGLLVNSPFDRPGTFTKPEIALAVAVLCVEAGAREIISLEGASSSYWHRATLSREHREIVETIRDPRDTTEVELPRGIALKRAEITRDLLECDVYINLPIFKDHEGTHFTGVMKNVMGTTSRSTNRFFHRGSGGGGGYSNPGFLSQCIADAGLIRMPDLCIGDATEVIVTNGPSGPGRIVAPRKVVAGTDGVAVDAMGASIIGLVAGEIATIR